MYDINELKILSNKEDYVEKNGILEI